MCPETLISTLFFIFSECWPIISSSIIIGFIEGVVVATVVVSLLGTLLAVNKTAIAFGLMYFDQ